MTNFKQIINFPGGGVKGVVSAVFLRKLVDQNYINLDKTYCISGTSTGSILTGLLCKPNPYSPSDIVEAYKELSSKIFARSEWLPEWASTLIYSAKYDNKKLKEVAESIFGNIRVGDCPKKFVITIYSLDEQMPNGKRAAAPLFITNFNNPIKYKFQDLKLSDVIIGSSSAPTYFYPHRLRIKGKWQKWVDGGLVDNASCLGALTEATQAYNRDGVDDDQIAMLTIGNGSNFWYDDASVDPDWWRLPKTMDRIINSIVQPGHTLSTKCMRSILGSRYYNVNYLLDKKVNLSDHESIDYLKEFAEKKPLNNAASWCRGYCV